MRYVSYAPSSRTRSPAKGQGDKKEIAFLIGPAVTCTRVQSEREREREIVCVCLCVGERERERLCVCMPMCGSARKRETVCVCVCVKEREREREQMNREKRLLLMWIIMKGKQMERGGTGLYIASTDQYVRSCLSFKELNFHLGVQNGSHEF